MIRLKFNIAVKKKQVMLWTMVHLQVSISRLDFFYQTQMKIVFDDEIVGAPDVGIDIVSSSSKPDDIAVLGLDQMKI